MPHTAPPDADDLDDAFDENDAPSFVPFKPKRAHAKRPPRLTPPDGVVLDDTPQNEADFHTTYTPSRHEKGWLLQSLRPFYDDDLVSDVEASVKGGKEASVYRCRASAALRESTGHNYLAAKVYRPRQFRNLRNDAVYRENRATLTADGREAKNSDTRLMRALGKKTDFGKEVAHTSWLMYEYTTLSALFTLGASVPKPIAHGENALLMEFIGADLTSPNPAPTLSETGSLGAGNAKRLFDDVLRNIEIFARHGVLHGDLSAYNILLRNEQIVVIDFPQVVRLDANPHAFELLTRDVVRVCEYFMRQGVPAHLADGEKLAGKLWARFGTELSF